MLRSSFSFVPNYKLYEQTFPEEQYQTTDSFASIRPVNGAFDLSKLIDYTIYVHNIGNNDAIVNILASVDGTNFDIILANSVTLNSKQYLVISFSTPYKKLQILAKSKYENRSTTLISKGYGFGGY